MGLLPQLAEVAPVDARMVLSEAVATNKNSAIHFIFVELGSP